MSRTIPELAGVVRGRVATAASVCMAVLLGEEVNPLQGFDSDQAKKEG